MSGQSHSRQSAPRTPETTPPAAGQAPASGSNQSRVEELGLGGEQTCAALPVAGEDGQLCWIPLLLKRGAAAGDELASAVQLEALAMGWGVDCPAGVTRLAMESSAADAGQVVELVWPGSWGERPLQTDLTGSLQPVEARLAVAALAKQPGWSAVSEADQGRLASLLGGETNALSSTARAAFKALIADTGWSGKSKADQARDLTGLLTSSTARPGLVDEPVDHLEAAPFTLTGPTLKKNHAFRGSTEDADVYDITFAGTGQVVKLYGPHAANTSRAFHTAQQVAEAVARLPEGSRKVVKTVTLNAVDNPDDAYWAQQYNDPTFHSYMTAGAAGEVTIYPSTGSTPSENYMRGTMIHETGHTWSKQAWGEDTTKGGWVKWKAAMDSDRASVSNYATNSLDEDVAETIQIYGGSTGTPAHDEYRRIVPARFAILDAELK